MKPGRGDALAYIDWSAQEVVIAAVLSGDPALLDVVRGDPYLRMAERVGMAPSGATKATHGRAREMFKTVVLAINYGMGAPTLAVRLGWDTHQAERLLRQLYRAFPRYWEWSQHAVDAAVLTGRMRSMFGWPLRVTDKSRPTALRNFPMQANGAEMMRLACCFTAERGISVCAPVHDALMVEAPASDIHDVVAATKAAMVEAGQAILNGFTLRTDAQVVSWPGRYADPRGRAMWDQVNELLDQVAP
jgi:DNA polymerase I-like protein with 3'-5' exonuclease and polymerase domains